MVIGILALQGDVREHKEKLHSLNEKTIEVRTEKELKGLDGLIIPGGESTTIGKLLQQYSLASRVKKMGLEGLPIYGTCAGLVLLAKKIIGDEQPNLKLMGIEVVRNAYGRQRESFETALTIRGFKKPFHAVFIRAPLIQKVGKDVEVMAEYNRNIVMARERNLLVSSFHPELTDDNRIHRYFLGMVEEWAAKKTLQEKEAG